MKGALVDHQDSFTFNLVHLLWGLGHKVLVRKHLYADTLELEALDALVLSAGPGHPKDYGSSIRLVKRAARRVPVLGICLGHQIIGVAFGAQVRRARKIMHGRTCTIEHSGRGPLQPLPRRLKVMRYNSLVLSNLPEGFVVEATDEHGDIMALSCDDLGIVGLQFHPESVLTEQGAEIVQSALDWAIERVV